MTLYLSRTGGRCARLCVAASALLSASACVLQGNTPAGSNTSAVDVPESSTPAAGIASESDPSPPEIRPGLDRPRHLLPAASTAAEPDAELRRTMIDDLVSALEQLRDPVGTTIQVGPIDSPVAADIVSRLAASGYGIQRVTADQGTHLLGYASALFDEPGQPAVAQLQITVGTISLSRLYRADGSVPLSPAGPLEISGTRRPVVLDDRRFGMALANDPSRSSVRYTSAGALDQPVPVISLITPELVRRVADVAIRGGPSAQAVNANRVEVRNRFYDDATAFGAVAGNYDRIDRQVVIFADDSLRLGDTGKQQIMSMVEQFVDGSDLISLVGCSNGPTRLEIGNEGLALGRSERVSEELMSLGVARASILDEGCWAPVSAGDRFPSRGVVIELLRKPV